MGVHFIKEDGFKDIEKIAHIGMTMGLSIGLFTYLGSLLDRKFGNRYLFTIIGFCWGFFGSLTFLIISIRRIEK